MIMIQDSNCPLQILKHLRAWLTYLSQFSLQSLGDIAILSAKLGTMMHSVWGHIPEEGGGGGIRLDQLQQCICFMKQKVDSGEQFGRQNRHGGAKTLVRPCKWRFPL